MEYEDDYRPVEDSDRQGRFLPGTQIEVIRPPARRTAPRHIVFDFDGTLSLIRQGWPEVMVPMMVEVLSAAGARESPEQLAEIVHRFVMELNGKQTIYQMIRLAEEVRLRGGVPEDPLVYKHRYHERLMQRIAGRIEGLRSGAIAPDEMLVPHSIEMLEELTRRGATLYLASGTDEVYVREEAELLGIARFFGRHVYGAIDDYRSFSKAMVIRRIIDENEAAGQALAGFGDGYVEIQNIKAVGGTAVAVASDEAQRSGRPDPWKRRRLVAVGADLVIPDYQDGKALAAWLWGE